MALISRWWVVVVLIGLTPGRMGVGCGLDHSVFRMDEARTLSSALICYFPPLCVCSRERIPDTPFFLKAQRTQNPHYVLSLLSFLGVHFC